MGLDPTRALGTYFDDFRIGFRPLWGEQPQYLHRGIAERGFERRFQLADHMKVTGAGLENGLLHIDLMREVPEALKPRTIAIGKKGKAARTISA